MSRFIFAGNEIIPGTVVMTADGTITPKDDLRVILNISGGGNVTIPDGTDTTQRIEIVNVSAGTCELTYKGTGGSTTASIYTNTGIRLLWVGSYWETSMSTAVTGIDDNSQPFAFNIDSLVKPDGVINLTGTDADGNPFDYGLGKLVTVADENNLVTGVEVKTSKTFNGKPIYMKILTHAGWTTNAGTIDNIVIGTIPNFDKIIHISGSAKNVGSYIEIPYIVGTTSGGHLWTVTVWIPGGTSDVNIQVTCASTGASFTDVQVVVYYTKTTD